MDKFGKGDKDNGFDKQEGQSPRSPGKKRGTDGKNGQANRVLHTKIERLTEHVVQVEALSAYLLIAVTVTFVLTTVAPEITLPVWLTAGLLLILLRSVITVTNPSSSVRNRLTWGAVLGGIGGMIVGATTDVVTGGLTGGQGTLLGFAGGTAAGAALGDWIQSWGRRDGLLSRGEAFDYLYARRRRSAKVANARLIIEALDDEIPAYNKNDDGSDWYSREDLEDYL